MTSTLTPTTKKIYEHTDVKKSIIKIKQRLKKVTESLVTGSASFSYSSTVTRANPFDIVRLFSEIKTDNDLDLTVRNIILNSIYSLE